MPRGVPPTHMDTVFAPYFTCWGNPINPLNSASDAWMEVVEGKAHISRGDGLPPDVIRDGFQLRDIAL